MNEPAVLFVSGEYPPTPGGVGDYTANLRAALSVTGARSQVLARTPATGDGVHTVAGWGWSTLSAVGALLEAAPVEVVHIQYQAGAFSMRPAINLLPSYIRRRHRIPVVTTYHDLLAPYLFPKAGRLRSSIVRHMARGSDAAIVTNSDDQRALEKQGLQPIRIPIGPNLPPPPPGLRIEPETVAFFGFPSRSKGIVQLVAALGRIDPAKRPRLLLIGDEGQPSRDNDILPRATVDALARASGVAVARTGYLPPERASSALARAEVIVLPNLGGASLRSGALLAALQTGRLVVTFAPPRVEDLEPLASMPQLLLVPTDDVAALVRCIENAPNLSYSVRELPAMFQWDCIAARHLEVYQSILERRAQR